MAETYSENQPNQSKKSIIGKIFISVITLLAVLISGVLGYSYFTKQGIFRDKNILATIGNEKITKADLNKRIYGLYFAGSPENPTTKVSDEDKKKYLNQLIDNKVIEIEAKQLSVSVNDNETADEINKSKARINFESSTNIQKEIIKENTRLRLLKEKLKEKVTGWKEGSYIMVNFSKNFSSDIMTTEDQRKKEDAGREQKIKEDSEYATNLINSISADIKSGKITFEEGMERAKNDPRFGVEGYKPNNTLQSDNFTKEDFINHYKVFSSPDIYKKASEVQEGKVSEPFTVKSVVQEGGVNGKSKERDGMLVIVRVNKGGNTLATSFDEWFEAKKRDLNIKIFDKKLAFFDSIFKDSLISVAKAQSCCGAGNYGINSHNGGNTAGLVVTTGWNDASNVWNPWNRTVSVQGTGGGVLYTPNGYWDGNNALNANFSTGSTTQCGFSAGSDNGFLVLGFGTTNSFGNYSTLHCSYNPFTVWTGTDGGPYGGKWYASVNSGAWMESNGTGWFNVANGWTTYVNLEYVVAPQPVCNSITVTPNPASDTEQTCVDWSTTGAVDTLTTYEAFNGDNSWHNGPNATTASGHGCSVKDGSKGAVRTFKVTPKNWAGVAGTSCQTTLNINSGSPTPTTPPPPPDLTCSISASPNPVSQLFPALVSWSVSANGTAVTDATVNSIDDTTTATANDIGTSLSTPGSRTVNIRNAGNHHYVMTASKSGYTNAVCSTDLKVNANTDSSGGTSAP